jgi:hypothetical protein
MHAARDSTDRPRRRRCYPVASPATAPLPGLELHRGRVLQPVEQVRAAVAVRTVAGELRRPVGRRARRGPPARGVAADEVRAGADAPHVVLADVEVCHGVQAPELDRRDVVSLCRFLLRACTTWTDTVLPLTLLMTSKSCICITAEFRSVLTVSASSTSDTHTQKKNLLNVPRYRSLFPATLPILACHLPCWWCLRACMGKKDYTQEAVPRACVCVFVRSEIQQS